jgi:hypothetical protein
VNRLWFCARREYYEAGGSEPWKVDPTNPSERERILERLRLLLEWECPDYHAMIDLLIDFLIDLRGLRAGFDDCVDDLIARLEDACEWAEFAEAQRRLLLWKPEGKPS